MSCLPSWQEHSLALSTLLCSQEVQPCYPLDIGHMTILRVMSNRVIKNLTVIFSEVCDGLRLLLSRQDFAYPHLLDLSHSLFEDPNSWS